MVIAGFSLMTMLLILLAGIGAGFVGYAVGASSLVSYPALLALVFRRSSPTRAIPSA